MTRVMVTGAAGFIGHAVCLRLAASGAAVLAVDSFDPYYEPALKRDRAACLAALGITVHELDVANFEALSALTKRAGVIHIVHLAAQAGVRHSIHAPFAYQHANIKGHLSVLECCRQLSGFKHLVYASSSSVYGNRPGQEGPFKEDDRVDKPSSLYAASKRAGELMSESYAHLYGIPQSGLRFFTVYGPWGRPDMAYFSFARRIFAGEPIDIFGNGQMRRDFTYIDDIVDGVVDVLVRPPDHGVNRLLNIGNDRPEHLLDFVSTLERSIGRQAVKVMQPMQLGDVSETWADIRRIKNLTGYSPRTTLEIGIPKFISWYNDRYNRVV